jgi:hypothetical protein
MSVSDTDVKAIFITELDTTPFINAAELIVHEEVVPRQTTNVNLSPARLDLITVYLAAHFAAITDQSGGRVRSKIGDTEEDYIPISSYREPLQGFRMTRYGQQAMSLDTTGALASMSSNAGLRALYSMMPQTADQSWMGWLNFVGAGSH